MMKRKPCATIQFNQIIQHSSNMRTIKLTVCYDGSNYFGFQRQAKEITVQQILEEKLARTDGTIPTANLPRALNSILPEDIRALRAEEAQPGFNARKDACRKEYEYRIRYTPEPDPFTRNYAWQMKERPDMEKMNEAAAMLMGTHDFSGFQSTGSTQVSPVKTIYRSCWETEADGTLVYHIAGNGFVYHMVRNLVWSMVQIGLGKKPPQAMTEELKQKRGEFENSPAPAQGLYLAGVEYESYNN